MLLIYYPYHTILLFDFVIARLIYLQGAYRPKVCNSSASSLYHVLIFFIQFVLILIKTSIYTTSSLGSRRFPVRTARDRYMGSKVGGASGKASGRTCTTDEFRAEKLLNMKRSVPIEDIPLAPSGNFDWSTTRTLPLSLRLQFQTC